MGEHAAVPVEYGVAVDRFLAAARISAASERVYRVALNTWGWLLVDRAPPAGPARRGARGPVVLLSRLDGPDGARNAERALDRRALMVNRRTLTREASILRNAAHWWASQGWIGADAQAAVKTYAPPGDAASATPAVPRPPLPAPCGGTVPGGDGRARPGRPRLDPAGPAPRRAPGAGAVGLPPLHTQREVATV